MQDRLMQQQVIDFLLDNPSPTDEQFHDFAESLGFSYQEVEEFVFNLCHLFLQAFVPNVERVEITANVLNDRIDAFTDAFYHNLKKDGKLIEFENSQSDRVNVLTIKTNTSPMNFIKIFKDCVDATQLPINNISHTRRGINHIITLNH